MAFSAAIRDESGETVEQVRRRRISEEVEIPRGTVQGLIETLRDIFRGPIKPERLVYVRGRKTVTVERNVPEDQLPSEGSDEDFLTPYQMIRQHAELEIQEPIDDSLHSLASAVQSLGARGFELTMFVCETRQVAREWLGRGLRIEDIWQVPLIEDTDSRTDGVFVVGSRSGPLVRDIEAAVLCRIG